MAAPLSGRRVLSFLLFFGGSMLSAVLLCRYLNIDILGAVTGKKQKEEDAELDAKEETLVSDRTNEEVDNLVRSEILKAANLAFTIPQPELAENGTVEAPFVDLEKIDDQEKTDDVRDVLCVGPATPERLENSQPAEGEDSLTSTENGISEDTKVNEYIENLVNTLVASNLEPRVETVEDNEGSTKSDVREKVGQTNGHGTEKLEEAVLASPASHGDQMALANQNNSNNINDDLTNQNNSNNMNNDLANQNNSNITNDDLANQNNSNINDNDYSLLGYDEAFSLDVSPVMKPVKKVVDEFGEDMGAAVRKVAESGDGGLDPESFDPNFVSLQKPSERGDSSMSDFSLLLPDDTSDPAGGDDHLSIGAVLVGAEDDDVITPVTSPGPVGKIMSAGEMEIRETFSIINQYGGGALTDKHARVLVRLMTSPNDDDVVKVLNVIQNCAAFTSSQNLLREAGCLTALSQTLRDLTMTSSTANRSKMAAVNGAIANLSVNEENQKTLQECIPALIDLLGMSEPDRATRLSGLRALTNLSTTTRYHGSYTRAIQELYSLLSSDDSAISRQAASVLVNLSTNDDMVPHLLAAKSPERGLSTLLSTEQPDLLLRLVAFLANLTTSVQHRKLDPSQLPVDEKAASPETMYTALYGVDNMKVKSKVFVLLQHENEEIRQNAKRTYSCFTGS